MKNEGIMHDQIVQMVEYAELIVRLTHAQELLDPNGGYFNEKEVYKSIETLKEQVHKEIQVHMRNSGINKRALILLDSMQYFLSRNPE